MKRLIEKIVCSGFITAWRLATVPTRRSPPSVNATTDGVVRPPSAFSMTVGSPPSSTAMHELVVPRSIPIVFAILKLLLLVRKNLSAVIADLFRFAGTAHLGERCAGEGRVWRPSPAQCRVGDLGASRRHIAQAPAQALGSPNSVFTRPTP